MEHITDIKINGNEISVQVLFKAIDMTLDSFSHNLEYTIENITLLEDEDQYFNSRGGDVTSTEYNDILNALERGEGYSEALENIYIEFEPYSLEDSLNI